MLGDLRRAVLQNNACMLPGVGLRFETFVPEMWKAVARGYVRHEHAAFVYEGLRYGFRAGLDAARLHGHRWFKNYPSALEDSGRAAVVRATMKRVAAQKTYELGAWSPALAAAIKQLFHKTAIFPLGCVEKPLEPGEMRPVDDHTRTGFNAATDLSFLRHSLTTYQEIARFLQQDYFMRVSDVDAAFPMLPLHPDLWPFMLFRFFSAAADPVLKLFVHVCGDFGTAGMPGVFKIFFADVVVNMARSAMVLTLPMPIYVDDMGVIGPDEGEVNSQMLGFQTWALAVCGVVFKVIKDKVASRRQLMLGFWWDSTTLTRTLEEKKLTAYVEMLGDFAARPSLSLKEMQSAAGRMQRAIMTFPPGAACLLVSLFTLMAGLKLPWHRRKVNKKVREDLGFVRYLLQLNLGRGYYSLKNFRRAPLVYSDASKQRDYSGGGYVSECGMYNFWQYGSRAARKPINYLEGDTVVTCCSELCFSWRRSIVPFGIDNRAVERSAAKGRSRSENLNVLIRELFALQVRHEFVLEPFWVASADNALADHLSRGREMEFLEAAEATSFWSNTAIPIRHGNAGSTRVLPEQRGHLARADFNGGHSARGGRDLSSSMRAARQLEASYRSNTGKDGPARRVMQLPAQVQRSTLFEGLSQARLARLEELLDNRLAASSWRKVQQGVTRWREVARAEGWPDVIRTDDPIRGAKLVTFVLSMVDESPLAYKSISLYLWGMRVWQTLQHQADPVAGVLGWESFMQAVKVLTWSISEPRRQTPLQVVEDIIDTTDLSSFEDVQFVVLMLCLLYTFSRTECPLPKSRHGFDTRAHWRLCDFDVRNVAGRPALCVRFQALKQDPRVERREAAGNEDWAIVGSIPGSKWCPVMWAARLQRLHGRRGEPEAPFFVSPSDRTQPYVYSTARRHFHRRQLAVGVPQEELSGFHGLRVLGYNCTKRGLGVEVAVAHGLWRSEAHRRYERFDLSVIARIPAVIAGHDEGDDEEPAIDGDARQVRQSNRRPVRGQEAQAPGPPLLLGPGGAGNQEAAVAPRDLVAASPSGMPPGWNVRAHVVPSGQRVLTYFGPRGLRARSCREAWRLHGPSGASGDAAGRANASCASAADTGAPRADSARSTVDPRTARPARVEGSSSGGSSSARSVPSDGAELYESLSAPPHRVRPRRRPSPNLPAIDSSDSASESESALSAPSSVRSEVMESAEEGSQASGALGSASASDASASEEEAAPAAQVAGLPRLSFAQPSRRRDPVPRRRELERSSA